MINFSKINFGNKITLLDCEIQNKSLFQGENLKFRVKWKFLDRLPLGQKICYYFTNGQNSTFFTLDTEQPITRKIYYSQFLPGETFEDIVSISIPYNLSPGKYEINAFLFPSDDFNSSDGINSSVWPLQKVVGQFEVRWQKDLSKKFSKYRVSEKADFFNAMIEFWNKTGSLEENPNVYMWADFAFTTNQRGLRIIELLKKYINIKDKKFLDVGCAYCGFLVAAKLAGAKSVEGIDINETLLSLGSKNLKDYNVEAYAHLGDILNEEYSKKSKFDVITCNDVIEHVLDPELAIKNISNMLSSGGVVMFEIPNMNNPEFVIKDGHFSAFAITLLDREDALNYFRDNYNGDYSSVGYYHELDFYKRIFNKYNLEFLVDDSTVEWVREEVIEEKILFLKNNLAELIKSVKPDYQKLVGEKVKDYLKNYDYNCMHMNKEERLLYYGPSFWTVVGKK